MSWVGASLASNDCKTAVAKDPTLPLTVCIYRWRDVSTRGEVEAEGARGYVIKEEVMTTTVSPDREGRDIQPKHARERKGVAIATSATATGGKHARKKGTTSERPLIYPGRNEMLTWMEVERMYKNRWIQPYKSYTKFLRNERNPAWSGWYSSA
ncbi:unnamed protein product [Chrysoparadoxa australica]